MKSNNDERVDLEEVWGYEDNSADADADDNDGPLIIKGVTRSRWDDLWQRVAAFRPSMRAGEIYGDGELCGVDWWLSQGLISQYITATCLRQPRLLKHYGLVLVAVPGSDVPCFAVATPQ